MQDAVFRHQTATHHLEARLHHRPFLGTLTNTSYSIPISLSILKTIRLRHFDPSVPTPEPHGGAASEQHRIDDLCHSEYNFRFD